MSTKGERREAKRRAARERIPRHGGALAAIYDHAARLRSYELLGRLRPDARSG
jgi:ribosomal protein L25 (general stress protein Ctc)